MTKVSDKAMQDVTMLEVRDGSPGRRKLSLRQIEVFRAVMISGSINGASQMLGVSQPSLSRVVKRTEDVLGFQLFERVKGRLVPTKEAGVLLAMVRRVYQQIDELGDAVERLTEGETGLFRFGTTGSPGRCLVPAAIAGLHRDLPKLAFHVDVLLIDQIIDYLLFQRGECVVSIFPVRHPLVQSTALGHGGLVALIPPDHRFAGRQQISADDLAKEFLISFEPETPHGAIVADWFRAAKLAPPIGVQIRHIETAIGLVANCVGIAIVDEFAAADAATLPFSVVRIKASPRIHIYLSWRREMVRSHFFKRFEGALIKGAKSQSMIASRSASGR
jgi:DNA-binding transcriptional LysR family regulator